MLELILILIFIFILFLSIIFIFFLLLIYFFILKNINIRLVYFFISNLWEQLNIRLVPIYFINIKPVWFYIFNLFQYIKNRLVYYYVFNIKPVWFYIFNLFQYIKNRPVYYFFFKVIKKKINSWIVMSLLTFFYPLLDPLSIMLTKYLLLFYFPPMIEAMDFNIIPTFIKYVNSLFLIIYKDVTNWLFVTDFFESKEISPISNKTNSKKDFIAITQAHKAKPRPYTVFEFFMDMGIFVGTLSTFNRIAKVDDLLSAANHPIEMILPIAVAFGSAILYCMYLRWKQEKLEQQIDTVSKLIEEGYLTITPVNKFDIAWIIYSC